MVLITGAREIFLKAILQENYFFLYQNVAYESFYTCRFSWKWPLSLSFYSLSAFFDFLSFYSIPYFPDDSVVKNPSANARDSDLIPGSGRSPGEGNGKPLQCSCLENPMDGGAWEAVVYGISVESDIT